MGILRSETMSRGTLVVPAERARDVLFAVGQQAPAASCGSWCSGALGFGASALRSKLGLSASLRKVEGGSTQRAPRARGKKRKPFGLVSSLAVLAPRLARAQGSLMFEDMNGKSMERAYKAALQRIEETDRLVRSLQERVDLHLATREEEDEDVPRAGLVRLPSSDRRSRFHGASTTIRIFEVLDFHGV